MYKSVGGCHCGNISFVIEISNDPASYNPRACDCPLCSTHGASYISDKKGSLAIKIKNEASLSKYRQGSKIADFLICKNCGVLVGVCYEEQGCLYGSVNTRAIQGSHDFGERQIISPRQFTDVERIKRWKDLWFSNVKIEIKTT
ncbi:hypothetical protein MNBD_GAMMA21-37 [hydrothermal vent metagenome]|uniref:CENP-V/GFA domain-containing protein n=1 Tax=hydrothermal vent metagenome TaxID=652676 RepID=A0A3B1AD73_9ZZZZ